MENGVELRHTIRLFITVLFILINILLSIPCKDSEHNVTIVDKKIKYADGISVHHVIYKTEYGGLTDLHSETVYYRCEVGKRYHVLIQYNGVWKSWSEIDE